jgi:hypothetical protein
MRGLYGDDVSVAGEAAGRILAVGTSVGGGDGALSRRLACVAVSEDGLPEGETRATGQERGALAGAT